MENEKLRRASIVLANAFVEVDHNRFIYAGQDIIRFVYKWFGTEEDEVQNAINEYTQHHEDCRFECYACRGECMPDEDFEKEFPSFSDEHILNFFRSTGVIETDEEEWLEPFTD